MNTQNLLPRFAIASIPFLMASALLSVAHAQPSVAALYDIVKLDYPGAPVSFPLSINSNREIVGVRVDAAGVYHGYLYQNGKFTDIDYPGALQVPGAGTFTGGLNDGGDVAGVFTDAKGFQHGFMRTIPPGCGNDRCKPLYQQIDVPGAVQTTGIVFELGTGLGTATAGINNLQEVAGMYATKGLYSVGFTMLHGKVTTIDDPASSHTLGNGSRVFTVNDFGVAAGAYQTQTSPTALSISHGFLYSGLQYIPVFVPGSDEGGFGTQANGINDLGEVVGVFSDQEGTFHGMLWILGQAFTLDFPKMPYSECHSINIRGDITGAYISDLTGENYRGFVAYLK